MKNNLYKILTVVLVVFCLSSQAQTKEENQKRIDEMKRRVDLLISETSSKDSLVAENVRLRRELFVKDSLLAIYSIRANGKFIAKGAKPGDEYIVIAAYSSEEAATKYRSINKLDEFEIVRSVSGTWFFLVKAVKGDPSPELKRIRQSVMPDAWMVRI